MKLVNKVKRLQRFHQLHLWLDVFSFRTGYVIFNPFINPNIVYMYAVFWHSEHCFAKPNAYEPSFTLVTLRLLDFMASNSTNRWHMIEKISTLSASWWRLGIWMWHYYCPNIDSKSIFWYNMLYFMIQYFIDYSSRKWPFD